jgi:hypothetical protein
VIAGNTMQRAFADGLALVVFFDEADGVTMYARVINNTIEASERRGVTIAESFDPSHNRVTIDGSLPLSDLGSASLGSGCLGSIEQGQEQVMHKWACVQHFNAEEGALGVVLRRHIGTEFDAGAFLSVRKPQIEDIFVGKIHQARLRHIPISLS